MRASWINLFVAGLSLLCLVRPLRSDLRSPSWENYGSFAAYPVLFERHDSPETRSTYVAQPVVVHEMNGFQGPRFSSYLERPRLPGDVKESESDQMRAEAEEEDAGGQNSFNETEIMEKMRLLDKLLSEDSNNKDFEVNGIEDGIIPEESRRVARQVRKQKPGFFWTLARVTFEAINDTRSAIKQISDIINNSIAPDSAAGSTMIKGSLTATASPTSTSNETTTNDTETTTTTPMTTTPYVLTRSKLQTLIRRNVKGLVRLFNIEWRDALNQSEVTVKEFQKDLGKQVGVYLRDNPRAY